MKWALKIAKNRELTRVSTKLQDFKNCTLLLRVRRYLVWDEWDFKYCRGSGADDGVTKATVLRKAINFCCIIGDLLCEEKKFEKIWVEKLQAIKSWWVFETIYEKWRLENDHNSLLFNRSPEKIQPFFDPIAEWQRIRGMEMRWNHSEYLLKVLEGGDNSVLWYESEESGQVQEWSAGWCKIILWEMWCIRASLKMVAGWRQIRSLGGCESSGQA